MSIKLRYNGLEVDGNLYPLLSATLEYSQMEADQWPSALTRVKELGFPFLMASIPWAFHETVAGEFDYGRVQANRSLDHFLNLANERGFKVILRPGLRSLGADAEGGFPERILAQESYWARDSFGAPAFAAGERTPFKLLSMANEGFINEFESFLSSLAPLLQKHLYPHGPVMALQLDLGLARYGRNGCYDLDYSEASLGLYRHFLELKYKTLKSMNEAYQSSLKSFGDVEAPRAPELSSKAALRRGMDWSEYQDYQGLWFLGRLAALFQAKGLASVPFLHAAQNSEERSSSVAEIEKNSGVELCGLADSGQADAAALLSQARYLAAQSQLAYLGEIDEPRGPLGLALPLSDDPGSHVLAPLMGGARALNFRLDASATLSAEAQALPSQLRRLNAFLEEQEWTKSSPQYGAVLLASRELKQLLNAAQRPGPRTEGSEIPAELWRLPLPKELVSASTEAEEALRFYEAGQNWLREGSYSYALGDSSIPAEKLKRFPLAILSSWALLDEAFAKRLKAYVEGGGLLVLGPEWPQWNQRLEALAAWGDLKGEEGKVQSLGEGRLLFLKSFDSKAMSAALRKAKLFQDLTLSDPSLDLALHKSGGRNLLFVRNPHEEERPCTVMREGKFVLKPLWSSGKFLGGVEEREVRLSPKEIKVWELIPC